MTTLREEIRRLAEEANELVMLDDYDTRSPLEIIESAILAGVNLVLGRKPTEIVLLRLMYELHSNVPEEQRPVGRCAFSDDQWKRIEDGYKAMTRELMKELEEKSNG